MALALQLGFLALVGIAHGYTPSMPAAGRAVSARGAVRMFFESQKGTDAEKATSEFVIQSRRNHASDLVTERTGASIVVTEGSNNFYGARTLVQMLHDFGSAKQITAVSDDAATTKKALLTRQARYSGLIDTLGFAEGEWPAAEAWLAINADEATLPAQLAAATQAGVSRIFLLLTADGPTACPEDVASLEATLQQSGLSYTVMRTGSLVNDGSSGGGLRLGELDLAVCDDVNQEDVFRFVTEALSLPEAEGRLFSLCPSVETEGALKQMRLCGYERREEVQALLKGLIEPPPAVEELSAEEAEQQKELVMRSEAEIAAEREDELKALLARARERGIATAAKLKYEEAEKARQREEMSRYYQAPPGDDAPVGDDTIASLEEAIKSDGEPPKDGDAPPESKDGLDSQ